MEMRKFYRLFFAGILSAAFLSGGCVDKEYSLDNMEEEEQIRVGNLITTPPVTARISFEGLLGGMSELEKILNDNGLSFEDIGKIPMDIGSELFLVDLPLDIPLIPEGMADMLGSAEDGDKIELILAINSTLPMSVAFRLEFIDSQAEVVAAFDEIEVQKSENGLQQEIVSRQDISSIIGRLSDIKSIRLTLLRPDTEKIVFLLDNYIELETRIEKSGGIALFSGVN